jgi:hypothetical protein
MILRKYAAYDFRILLCSIKLWIQIESRTGESPVAQITVPTVWLRISCEKCS